MTAAKNESLPSINGNGAWNVLFKAAANWGIGLVLLILLCLWLRPWAERILTAYEDNIRQQAIYLKATEEMLNKVVTFEQQQANALAVMERNSAMMPQFADNMAKSYEKQTKLLEELSAQLKILSTAINQRGGE